MFNKHHTFTNHCNLQNKTQISNRILICPSYFPNYIQMPTSVPGDKQLETSHSLTILPNLFPGPTSPSTLLHRRSSLTTSREPCAQSSRFIRCSRPNASSNCLSTSSKHCCSDINNNNFTCRMAQKHSNNWLFTISNEVEMMTFFMDYQSVIV